MITIDMEKETQSIDYKTMTLEALIATLKKMIDENPIQDIKEQASAIRASFYYQYNEQLEKAKDLFVQEGGNEIDFEYSQPIQTEFKDLWKSYVEKKNSHYKKIVKELATNLAKREEVIASIKALVEKGEVSSTYKEFQQLMADWKEIGPVPSDKYQETWGNYHLYVEQYYDLLHINNDLRAIDFKHNLEAKKQIIERAKQLLDHADVQFAFNELQILHKIWKEETGPVAKEFREPVWEEFSSLSNAIHDKRSVLLEELRNVEEKNYEQKLAKIQEIKNFDFSKNKSFGDWKKSIDAFEALKEEFLAIGKIPKNKNKQIWDTFKEATKEFNSAKNNFFKEIKSSQNEAISSKKALIEEALAWKDSEDFDAATEVFKRIQAAWKKVGFVPRKQADVLWKEFKTACDAYFDRLNNVKKEGTPEEQENYNNKEAFLAKLADKEINLDNYKILLKEWIALGLVPSQKNKIDQDILQFITKAITLPKEKVEAEFIKYQLKIAYLLAIDSKKLYTEYDQLRNEVDSATKDLKQLENNLGFFSNTKKSNPLFETVMKSIETEKKKLLLAKKKIKYLKSFQ
ncbi:DUF349 domain-containing protein [Wenyingzhuangia marina]|uniref:DUF349 domain-containing protein n=1 Tax=Wenyingzhuangia marina TaxID=1195760 RepID=A0A1M5VUG4_9FLAO|nr:DUF349 domain-containing protein [Wenyingzhuangia marina]GGF77769.1 hypothetical protein GCM10011397_20970 [Wenyingzhuangia marina]SHH78929.1 protein of unknown function [Wenyingzhuangia marina]